MRGVVLGHAFFALCYAGLDFDRGVQGIERVPALVEARNQFLRRDSLGDSWRLGHGQLARGGKHEAPGEQERKKQRCDGRPGESLLSSATRLLHGVSVAGYVAVLLVQRAGKHRMPLGIGCRRRQSRDNPFAPAAWPRAATSRRDWPSAQAAGRRGDRCCTECRGSGRTGRSCRASGPPVPVRRSRRGRSSAASFWPDGSQRRWPPGAAPHPPPSLARSMKPMSPLDARFPSIQFARLPPRNRRTMAAQICTAVNLRGKW